MPDSFVHLHNHTEFSMLDGAARIQAAVAKAANDGQPAMGITDHGNMYGILDFYKACRKAGIKPVLGTEAYMAHEHRSERLARRGRNDEGGGSNGEPKNYYHLTLLAETNEGYANLIKLSSRAFLEGFYYKPRTDWELLAEHSKGLIATTGCLGGHVLDSLKAGKVDQATSYASRLRDIFGPGNLFAELQDHGLADQHRTNPQLIEIARRLDIPLLATNDAHYTDHADHVSHDALLCVQTASTMDDPNRFNFGSDQHYIKTAAEMRRLFAELPQACDNTLLIAERANVEIEFGKPQLPVFPLPEGQESDAAYLRHLTYQGAHQRWGPTLPAEVAERLDFELGVIGSMGFDAYFLIVWDLVRYARERNIRVGPGRGSAAGCAVAYCLRITDLDPIRYDLLFERFLNPSRISMPDIDMDFDSRYRDEMIRYAADRYGRDHVAQLVTFSTIKARAAVRDATRVLGLPYSVGDGIAKAMPKLIMGRDTPLGACLEPTQKYEAGYALAADLRTMYATDPDAKLVIDTARGLEGLRRQDGIHASAVVITRNPLTDYLPVQRKPALGQDPEEAPVVTQYEGHGVEDLGLLKMDFLGLRNLDVMSETIRLVRESRGVEVDIDQVDLTDGETLALLRRGESIGVFQLEGSAMRDLMLRLAPTSYDDIAALVALYRPGPMSTNMHTDYADRKNGRKKVTYIHPDMEELLGETQGLMIYQESMMRVAQRFAGYSLAEADNLRKAAGKKIRALMAAEREKFVAGCVATGYGEELGTKLFDIIEPFADYAFNRSHSYGYGFIAFQTAYLKTHYPAEYMAALLTSTQDDKDKSVVYLAECRRMKLAVLPPDVNRSIASFSVVASPDDPRGAISFGLAGTRNVGEGVASAIAAEREAKGPFVDFYDFCGRLAGNVLNKRSVESLIKAGAFDSLGLTRKGLLYVFESIIDRAVARSREAAAGIVSLFEATPDSTFDERTPIPASEFEKKELLGHEKEMLGVYVSDHPLGAYVDALARICSHPIAELSECEEDGQEVVLVGIVSSATRRYTKRGDLMGTFTLEDLTGAVEVTLFPKNMTLFGHLMVDDAIVMVKGRLGNSDDRLKVIADQLQEHAFTPPSPPLPVAHTPPPMLAPARATTPASAAPPASTGPVRGPVPRPAAGVQAPAAAPTVRPGPDAPPPAPTPLLMEVALQDVVVTEVLLLTLKQVLRRHPGPLPVRLHLDSGTIQLPPEWAIAPSPGLVAEIKLALGGPRDRVDLVAL